jgi:hypothetical protein
MGVNSRRDGSGVYAILKTEIESGGIHGSGKSIWDGIGDYATLVR